MPYIKQEQRLKINHDLLKVSTPDMLGQCMENTGELNYLITRIISGYMAQHGKKYQTMNDIVGVLESAKAEFQRRVVANFENKKIEQNGDVY